MPVSAAVGLSAAPDTAGAFADAAGQAAAGLDGPCDLAVVFAGGEHLLRTGDLLDAVHDRLAPAELVGCGAGGVVAGRREIEDGDGAVVWALSAPGGEIATHRLLAEPDELAGPDAFAIDGLPGDETAADSMVVLCDPRTFPAAALVAELNETRPGMPVLGGLASAAAPNGGALLHGRDEVIAGAVAVTFAGVPLVPCVSQGAEPIGPEMTITACEGNVIAELASRPAVARLREVVEELDRRERRLAVGGLLLGIVIDENRPDHERGDFLVRPIVGADENAGAIAIGERVRVGQTVRLHVRDPASADEDLREALRLQAAALHEDGAAGALIFTCNGRGEGMFGVPDHDAAALADALGAPSAGLFCAGEIGPVGGRNFLHGFTATIAVFPSS